MSQARRKLGHLDGTESSLKPPFHQSFLNLEHSPLPSSCSSQIRSTPFSQPTRVTFSKSSGSSCQFPLDLPVFLEPNISRPRSLFPTTFIPLRFLSITSLLGIVSSVSLIFVLIADGTIKTTSPGSLWVVMPTSLSPHWERLPLCFGLYMSGFSGHAIIPSIYRGTSISWFRVATDLLTS